MNFDYARLKRERNRQTVKESLLKNYLNIKTLIYTRIIEREELCDKTIKN